MTAIIFIDDSENDIDTAQWTLHRAGILAEVLRVQSELELTRLLGQTNIDLIVSDFQASGLDCIKVLDVVQSIAPKTPFIFYTGEVLPAKAILALRHGAYGCVEKAQPDAFVEMIKNALSTSQGVAQVLKTLKKPESS